MNFDVLIPQVWYDFIGRIIPGTYVLSYLLWLHEVSGPDKLSLIDKIPEWLKGYSFCMAFLALTIAYLIGLLVGGLWLWVGDKIFAFNRKYLTQVMTEEENKLYSKKVISNKLFSDCLIPFIYDYIQLGLPKMGARIAKLRGEQHLCGTLIFSSTALGILTLFIDKHRPIYILPFAVVLLAIILHRHLVNRAGKAMMNGWVFLRKGCSEK